jgi:LPXTG-motif cell wall-anchored protein
MARRTISSMLVALMLAAVPATAFADGGAGDNQYQDPFASPPAAKKPAKKQTTTTPTTTVAPAASTTPAATAAPAAQPAAASSTPRDLPHTGFPADWVAAAGIVLLGAGVVLRRRSATQ